MALAVAIACVIAGLRAIASDATFRHTFATTLVLLGCLYLLLAVADQGGMNMRKAQAQNWWITESHGFAASIARAAGPTLAPSAVLAFSGIASITLAILA